MTNLKLALIRSAKVQHLNSINMKSGSIMLRQISIFMVFLLNFQVSHAEVFNGITLGPEVYRKENSIAYSFERNVELRGDLCMEYTKYNGIAQKSESSQVLNKLNCRYIRPAGNCNPRQLILSSENGVGRSNRSTLMLDKNCRCSLELSSDTVSQKVIQRLSLDATYCQF